MPPLRLAALPLLLVVCACGGDTSAEDPLPPSDMPGDVSDASVNPEPDVYTTPMAPEAVRPEDAGAIAGRVVGPDGEPMINLNVIVKNPEIGVTTGGDGRYILPQVPPGRQTVTFRGPAVLDSVDVTVTTGDTTRLDHSISFMGQ
jgi:hypothetical protein